VVKQENDGMHGSDLVDYNAMPPKTRAQGTKFGGVLEKRNHLAFGLNVMICSHGFSFDKEEHESTLSLVVKGHR
jgi:hypothetical protein